MSYEEVYRQMHRVGWETANVDITRGLDEPSAEQLRAFIAEKRWTVEAADGFRDGYRARYAKHQALLDKYALGGGRRRSWRHAL